MAVRFRSSSERAFTLRWFLRNTTFPIPGTDITLGLTFGRRLPVEEVTSLLFMVEEFVTEITHDQFSRFAPATMPFTFTLQEKTEFQAYNTGELPSGMTWEQLQNTIHGLWVYMIGGEHFLACHFDIYATQTRHVFTHIGWGNIVQANEPSPNPPGKEGQSKYSQHTTMIQNF